MRAWRARAAALVVLALACMAGAAQPASPATPTTTVEQGRLAGEAAGSISIFRGVPYAAAPVGPLRWRAPQAPAQWQGVRPARAFGPPCPQAGAPGVTDITRYGGAPEPTSEDCLTLNVWAPAARTDRTPVMVWFHGGSGRMGAGSLPYYDGSAFARDGVVLVTVNYRLGHLGAFDHPALTREANGRPAGDFALQDQIAALRWVRKNIAGFGGDPRNVTIFGESSGGISVLTLLTSPAAQGLFQKAIVESAGGWYAPPPDLKASEAQGELVARAAGAPAHASVAQLRALPARAVAAAPQAAASAGVKGLTPDGGPTIAIDAGRQATVPLLIGVNDGEDSLLDYGGGLAQAKASVKPEEIARVRRLYGPGTSEEMAIRYELRDGIATAPARWVARKWSRKAPAYLYRFQYVDEGARARRSRAPHGGEVPYVFETLGRQPDASAPTAADARMAAEVHGRWVAFAKTGRPDLPGAPRWPAYDAAQDPWMVFDPKGSAVRNHLLKPQLDSFESRFSPLILLMRVKTDVGRLFGG